MGFNDIKFPKETKFLVTGGAGFIGSNLCLLYTSPSPRDA